MVCSGYEKRADNTRMFISSSVKWLVVAMATVCLCQSGLFSTLHSAGAKIHIILITV